ncbi:MAG: DNA alkylation repair protein [Bacteroidetes bacterium]|jgi:3-methyladenine DNA glycosylase AlkD|nr:DNA alkylation repair protein [Bacteroidota bacterium]
MANDTLWLEEIEWALQSNQNTDNAKSMSAYMKNHFPFPGIKKPERQQLIKEISLQNEPLTKNETIKIARKLWHKPEREYQYVALSLLNKQEKKFNLEDIESIEYFLSTKSWWDTVDMLATNTVASYFNLFPKQISWVTNNWMKSGNKWLQRSCILFQLKKKSQTDVSLLAGFITQLADSPDFFIQKAIGWALREYSKTDPDFVSGFIHQHPLASLSKREALKVINQGT